MKTLLKHVKRAVIIANSNDLVVNWWSPRKIMDLYMGVRHLFTLSCITSDLKRRYETMSWKTYLNLLMKRKWKLCGEKWWFRITVKRLVQSENNIYQNNTKLNCIYNQSNKNNNWMFGEDSGNRKNNAIPSPSNYLKSSLSAGRLCPPTIILWIGK